MSDEYSLSRNGVRIRLTEERLQHIIEEHAELHELRGEILAAVDSAERVLSGSEGELLAVRMLEPGKAIVVVYREVSTSDGFIITAFITRRLRSLDRRVQVWPSQT